MFLVAALTAAVGCSDGAARELIAHDRWSTNDVIDPWPEHAPAAIECSSLAWGEELSDGASVFEVDTGACNYLVVGQGTLEAIDEGDVVTARVSHGDLESGEDSEAHVAVVVGDWIVLDHTTSIPAGEGVLEIREPAPSDLEAGTDAVLHLHNHGANTWNLGVLSVEGATE